MYHNSTIPTASDPSTATQSVSSMPFARPSLQRFKGILDHHHHLSSNQNAQMIETPQGLSSPYILSTRVPQEIMNNLIYNSKEERPYFPSEIVELPRSTPGITFPSQLFSKGPGSNSMTLTHWNASLNNPHPSMINSPAVSISLLPAQPTNSVWDQFAEDLNYLSAEKAVENPDKYQMLALPESFRQSSDHYALNSQHPGDKHVWHPFDRPASVLDPSMICSHPWHASRGAPKHVLSEGEPIRMANGGIVSEWSSYVNLYRKSSGTEPPTTSVGDWMYFPESGRKSAPSQAFKAPGLPEVCQASHDQDQKQMLSDSVGVVWKTRTESGRTLVECQSCMSGWLGLGDVTSFSNSVSSTVRQAVCNGGILLL